MLFHQKPPLPDFRPSPFLFLILFPVLMACNRVEGQPVIWTLNDISIIGNVKPVIIGEPRMMEESQRTFLSFNGTGDGILIPLNPVRGWKKFTIEVLFKPDRDGNPEQRFLHFQDINGNRGLVEIRLGPDGHWCLDTYLHNGITGKGLTLIDRSRQHPGDAWYWAALVYDGKTMKHFVNGVEELSGEVCFGPVDQGAVSIGVRLNQVFWFKGGISEIRFSPEALDSSRLQNF